MLNVFVVNCGQKFFFSSERRQRIYQNRGYVPFSANICIYLSRENAAEAYYMSRQRSSAQSF